MSTLYVCKSCLNEQEFYNAVMATPANDYKSVSTCPDCMNKTMKLVDYTLSEVEVLTILDSQESYSNEVESNGGYGATTLELIRGILELDPENDEEYNDYALIDLIELAIEYHRNHKDKD